MQAVLGRQSDVRVPGVSSVDRGKWGQDRRNIFLYPGVLAFHEGRIIPPNVRMQ